MNKVYRSHLYRFLSLPCLDVVREKKEAMELDGLCYLM